MDINYEHYRVFYHVARCRNLTTAAKLLHNDQPNLSRIIRLMEHAFGCPLLIRSNRGITLTPEGERLYAHVKIAVEQLQAAVEELQMVAGLHQGTLTVGASETALRLLLLPVLGTFKKSHPDIRIRIQNHLTAQAMASVQQGTVDFAVVVSPAVIPKPLKSTPLIDFVDILIGGRELTFLSEQPISFQTLSAYPLICLGEHTTTYQCYDAFYRAHGSFLKPELEAATTDQILPMVQNGLGLGFIPEIFAKGALAAGEVCQILLDEELPHRQICLVENKERPLSVTAGTLKTMLVQYALGGTPPTSGLS